MWPFKKKPKDEIKCIDHDCSGAEIDLTKIEKKMEPPPQVQPLAKFLVVTPEELICIKKDIKNEKARKKREKAAILAKQKICKHMWKFRPIERNDDDSYYLQCIECKLQKKITGNWDLIYKLKDMEREKGIRRGW